MLTLILGGARSGKSEHAEDLAKSAGAPVCFIATAQSGDEEMRERIRAHRENRPRDWETLELPVNVGEQLLAGPPRRGVIVLDCLTLLVSNRVLEGSPDPESPDGAKIHALVRGEVDALLHAVEQSGADWIVVSNEVGLGVVPAYPLGRVFRDELGWANKQIAARADQVIWMVAGIPVPIAQHHI